MISYQGSVYSYDDYSSDIIMLTGSQTSSLDDGQKFTGKGGDYTTKKVWEKIQENYTLISTYKYNDEQWYS